MESFGRYLRSEREQRGIEVEEISGATKISPSQLRALEADDLSSLPTLAYVKGFIRAYSKHIGLDPNEVVARFEAYLTEIEQESATPEAMAGPREFIPADREHMFKRDTPHLGMVVAAGGIIFLLIVVLIVLGKACGGDSEAQQRVKPSPTATAAPVFSGEYSSAPTPGSVAPAEEETQCVVKPLPTVPPEAYRVRNTAPPPYPPASQELSSGSDSSSPGGGATSSSP